MVIISLRKINRLLALFVTWTLWPVPQVTALISNHTIDCFAKARHDWGQQMELCQKSHRISACADLSAAKAIGADQISNPVRLDWAKHVNLDLRRPEFDFTRGRTFLLGFTWCHVIRYLIQLLQQNYQTVIDDWSYSTHKYIYAIRTSFPTFWLRRYGVSCGKLRNAFYAG